MNMRIDRRRVIQGIGHAAAFGGLAATLSRAASAAQAAAAAVPAPQKVCLTMLYPSEGGHTFDANRFRDGHVAVLKAAYGNSIERVELRVPIVPPAPPAPAEGQPTPPVPPAPPLMAAVSIYIASPGDFSARAGAAARTVGTDLAAVTKSPPIVQFDMIEAAPGEPQSSVIGGSIVVSNYYFAKAGSTWSKDYFGKTYAPRLMEAYGAAALQRVEVLSGYIAQGGGNPQIAGAIHVYVKDTAAYDTAVISDPVKALAAEAAANSTLNPVTMLMTVHATG